MSKQFQLPAELAMHGADLFFLLQVLGLTHAQAHTVLTWAVCEHIKTLKSPEGMMAMASVTAQQIMGVVAHEALGDLPLDDGYRPQRLN